MVCHFSHLNWEEPAMGGHSWPPFIALYVGWRLSRASTTFPSTTSSLSSSIISVDRTLWAYACLCHIPTIHSAAGGPLYTLPTTTHTHTPGQQTGRAGLALSWAVRAFSPAGRDGR